MKGQQKRKVSSASAGDKDDGAHQDILSDGKRIVEGPSTSTAYQKSASCADDNAPKDGKRDDINSKEIDGSSSASTEQEQKSTSGVPTNKKPSSSSSSSVLKEQVYTAPTPSMTNRMQCSGPYNDRDIWTRRVTRPFDEDDDGSESYMIKTEEEIYFHRGALLHYLHNFKNDSKKNDTTEH